MRDYGDWTAYVRIVQDAYKAAGHERRISPHGRYMLRMQGLNGRKAVAKEAYRRASSKGGRQ